jgi:pimeloyl-ACP methyl ester carboxylesterase
LDHLGVAGDITLVLHDWGGMIGTTFAVRHPERIKRIVLLNTGGFHLPRAKPLPLPIWMVRDTPLGGFLARGLNAFSLGAVKWCVTKRPLSAEAAAGYLSPYDSWANRIGVHRFVQDIPLEPTDPSYDLVTETQERLGQLADLPILILWGEKDFVFDEHFLEEWRRHWPKAEVVTFPEAGHYVIEDEREEIVGRVRGFLEANALGE